MNVCFAPRPIVFDLDGTLIDSAPDIHAAVNAVLRENGTPKLTLDQVRSFIGGGVDVLWQKVRRATGLPETSHTDLVAGFMSRYHDATGLTQLFPGVLDALGNLADRGHPLGICTNKPMGPTKAILDHFGIRSVFQTIVGGDSLPEKKPDPAPLLLAFSGLGADPRKPDGIYVGDSEFDAECARRANVPFLIYSKGYRMTPIAELPHLAQFADFQELSSLVEDVTAR